MATLAAIVGSTTVTLSDRNPFALLSARGMGRSGVRRVTAQGPAQHGDTDLGYRLAPRELELKIGFRATTDAILDGYRDTLTSIFKPLSATPVNLRYTRDDGGVRQLDCNVVGEVDIRLVKEHRISHYHEATIRLRAPEPAWYNPTAGSVSVLGTSLVASQWWLAGGLIGSAQAVYYGTAPAQGSVWTYAGTPTSYTIAFSGTPEPITDGKFAFYAGAGGGSPAISFSTSGTTIYKVSATYPTGGVNLGSVMTSGTQNYFVSYEIPGGSGTAGAITIDRDTTFITSENQVDFGLGGTARRWRSDSANNAASRWTSAIAKYAVFVPVLTDNQLNALSTFMDYPDSSVDAQSLPIPYLGDLPESPVLSITGPVTNPSITNLATGETIDFGTITIGAGTTYLINTRYGQNSVLFGTVNKDFELTDDSDLGDFHLAPAPTATGGTNVLNLNGTAMGTATRFAISYYDRFQSY